MVEQEGGVAGREEASRKLFSIFQRQTSTSGNGLGGQQGTGIKEITKQGSGTPLASIFQKRIPSSSSANTPKINNIASTADRPTPPNTVDIKDGIHHKQSVNYPARAPQCASAPWPAAGDCHVGYVSRKRERGDTRAGAGASVFAQNHCWANTGKDKGRNTDSDTGNDSSQSIGNIKRDLHASYVETLRNMHNRRPRFPTGGHGPSSHELAVDNVQFYLDSVDSLLNTCAPVHCHLPPTHPNQYFPPDHGDLWTASSAPISSDQVVGGSGDNMIAATYLRDWLRELAIPNQGKEFNQNNSDGSYSGLLPGPFKTRKIRTKISPRKKRILKKKAVDDLDDFIVDDLDEDEMTESTVEDTYNFDATWKMKARKLGWNVLLDDSVDDNVSTDPSSSCPNYSSPTLWDAMTMPRTAKTPWVPSTALTNAILISGPTGSSKTSMVYAVARELDWDVFELNTSSRRSKTEIERAIGMIGENHIVKRSSSKFGTMSSAANGWSDRAVSSQTVNSPHAQPTTAESQDTPRDKKSARPVRQSVILLDDADILYDEDKAFWPTIVSIIAKSRRPVIMVAQDVQSLPLDDLPLQNILNTRPSSFSECVRVLQRTSAEHGHLSDSATLNSVMDASTCIVANRDYHYTEGYATEIPFIFRSLDGYDLRKAINDLQMMCQEVGKVENFLKPGRKQLKDGFVRMNMVVKPSFQRQSGDKFHVADCLHELRLKAAIAKADSDVDVLKKFRTLFQTVTAQPRLADNPIGHRVLQDPHNANTYDQCRYLTECQSIIETSYEALHEADIQMEELYLNATIMNDLYAQCSLSLLGYIPWKPKHSLAMAETVDWVRTLAKIDEDRVNILRDIQEAGEDYDMTMLGESTRRMTRAGKRKEYLSKFAPWPGRFGRELAASRTGTYHHLNYLDSIQKTRRALIDVWHDLWKPLCAK